VTLELRKSSRYRLNLGVTYRWTGPAGEEFVETGDTRDIGAAGMFVISDACPPRDAELSYEITVPRSSGTGSLQIQGTGRVIRIEPVTGMSSAGFAVYGDMRVGSEDISNWLALL
jgi:hypothetical protein